MASSAAPVQYTAFMDEPPIVEISGGVAILRYRSGGCCSERAMSLPTLARSAERVERALKRYAAGERCVVVDD